MKLAVALSLGLAWIAGTSKAQDSADTAVKNLIGVYQIVSGEDNGKPAPAERIMDTTVTITADTIIVKDKENHEQYSTTYKLATTKKPYRVDMTENDGPRGRKGAKAIGIIESDGDTVKLAYCYEGGILPTEFKTKAGEKQLMFVMKRKATK